MYETYLIALLTVLGALLGSFSTMLIWRLHFEEKGILTGRSQCPNCKSKLGFWNLIPIFSWVFQKGKCHHCKKNISFFYPLSEFVFMSLFFLFSWHFISVEPLFLVWTLGILFFSLVLFFYDLKFFEVDERIVWPAILWALGGIYFYPENWQSILIGGGVGFGFYAFQYFVSKGRWVGAGDMRLGLFMGIVLGAKLFLLSLFFAYILGTVIAMGLMIFKGLDRHSKLPMGAFLMPALLLFLYEGGLIYSWYMNFLGIGYF